MTDLRALPTDLVTLGKDRAAIEARATWQIQWAAFTDLVRATSAGDAARSWARPRRLTLDQAVVAVTHWTHGEPASEPERWEVSCYDGLATARPHWTDPSKGAEAERWDLDWTGASEGAKPVLAHKLFDLARWVLTMGRGHA